MRILWENYLEDATITATNENASYPLTNLYHKFLKKKYVGTANSVVISVVLKEDKPVSMIAYGYNNVIQSGGDRIVITDGATDRIVITDGAADRIVITPSMTYKLKSSTGTILATGSLMSGEDVNVTTFDAVTCREIEMQFSAEDIIYIGGLSIGDPLEYEYNDVNPLIADMLRSVPTLTEGLQLIGKQKDNARKWSVTIPDAVMTNAKRLETREMLESISTIKPFFAEFKDGSTDEPAIYGHITDAGEYQRDSESDSYTMSLKIEEAR